MIPSWSDLPTPQRRKLAVLIGQLALRRLSLPGAVAAPQVEAADERAVEPRQRSSSAGQDPAPPS
jgi:hypothetical protein